MHLCEICIQLEDDIIAQENFFYSFQNNFVYTKSLFVHRRKKTAHNCCILVQNSSRTEKKLFSMIEYFCSRKHSYE